MRVWSGLAVLFVTVSVGCGEHRIDASSEDAMEESIEQLRQTLSDEERREFDEALDYLTGDALADVFDAAFRGEELDGEGLISEVRGLLHGRTAPEVIETARGRQRSAALREIEELEAKSAQFEVARTELSRFEVTRARLSHQETLIGSEPVIELSVLNGTDHPIRRAYFRGVVQSPDRSVPWIEEDFNYQIRGGLEPGEAADWRLAPNMFSPWGTTDVPPDAVLTVEVVRLDGPGGDALFDARDWTERDEERLRSLRKAWLNGE